MNTLYQNAHSSERGALSAFQFLDVFIVVIGAVPALILGAPSVGIVVGGGGWIIQRAVQVMDRRLTDRLRDPTRQVGVHVTEAFGRIWLLVGAIVVAYVAGGRQAGLTAALLILVAYSVAFGVRLMNGQPPEREVKAS